MKTLTSDELKSLAGEYFAPEGLYHYTKDLPFLGTLQCSTESLVAGEWKEIVIEYTVGGSGLADGAWIKGTFKFYSDWALFQTSDPKSNNYVSAEYFPAPLHPGQTAATVQSLSVRFDQKGHERPFQKAIIIDVVDGYINPGDKIIVRLGDRRWGAKGTRVQTFVEDNFLMRWYIDPVGTSRFAPIKPDISFNIKPGAPVKAVIKSPRVIRPFETFWLIIHIEDIWGNATLDIDIPTAKLEVLKSNSNEVVIQKQISLSNTGWTNGKTPLSFEDDGDYVLELSVPGSTIKTIEHITVLSELVIPKPFFADLHVHSDDTVGTNSTTYNFSYGREIAGLDVIGYTANDFNVTKERWDKTLEIIKQVNSEGEFVVFPGTEWCGNSAAGGDHNVVFLDDPAISAPEFPFDKNGNVARSFEWNEDGPSELVPGAWPLDEVYATYAHSPEKNLLIPHVGGRRCNLAWHHPQLERLLEIGSAWGLFEWLLRDAVKRGWRMGVSANSDEHRGRCGGGVPGTAVFGTKGGLTGVLADSLDRKSIATALRARRTFATTGERLVGLVSVNGNILQGDELVVPASRDITFKYGFYGSKGFSSIEAWDVTGQIFHRDLQQELSGGSFGASKVRVKWGGARLHDRYREAVWDGSIIVSGGKISQISPFGGVNDVPSEHIDLISDDQIIFNTRTSGDFDGVDITFADSAPTSVTVAGHIGGYVKIGSALDGNPHKPQSSFSLELSKAELEQDKGKQIFIKGGVDLFVSVETVANVQLPRRVEGDFTISASERSDSQAVYFVGREYSGGKVITSPFFIDIPAK